MPEEKLTRKPKMETWVNLETGEYFNTDAESVVNVRSKKQKYAIETAKQNKKDNLAMKEWNKELGGFIFVLFKYCDRLMQQYPEITSEDIVKLFYLATFVDFDGNLIYQNVLVTKKALQEMLKLNSKSAFLTFFNKMIRLNVLIFDENEYIKINTKIFVKGSIDKSIKKDYDYTRLYVNSIRYIFENVNSRKHKQLGACFKLLPYIHRQRNTLCLNPEAPEKEIIPMRLKDIAEILNYHKKGIIRLIKDLVSIKFNDGNGMFVVVLGDSDFGKGKLIANPTVFYGGNKVYEVYKEFDDKETEQDKMIKHIE